jgi:nicotinate-nucleotide adenylyltransferase
MPAAEHRTRSETAQACDPRDLPAPSYLPPRFLAQWCTARAPDGRGVGGARAGSTQRMAIVDSVLLFGGSFDPVHHGHLIIARHAAEQMGVDRVVMIPSATPPHKRDRRLAPAADRLAMCRLAVGDDPQFEVSDYETTLDGPNYTFNTIAHFRQRLGAAVRLRWLVGMDSLNELGTWYRAAELVEACTIVTAARPGYTRPEAGALERVFAPAQIARLHAQIIAGPHIDISGTDIRARLRAGASIRYLVPEAVRAYIEARGLYRA